MSVLCPLFFLCLLSVSCLMGGGGGGWASGCVSLRCKKNSTYFFEKQFSSQITELADFLVSNLAVLVLLADLTDWNTFICKRTWNLVDLDFSTYPFSCAKLELAISVFRPLNFQLAVPNYGNSQIHWFVEASLIDAEFTISVYCYCSSCHSLFFSLIHSLFFSCSVDILTFYPALGMPINGKRK